MNKQVFNALCTPQARNIVRHVFRHRQDVIGLDSHEIYETAFELYPHERGPEPPKVYGEPRSEPVKRGWQLPPQPLDHPIRSMKYLKRIVLDYMAAAGEVEKVVVRPTDERDEQGLRHQILRSKTEGLIPVPPEKRHPAVLDSSQGAWLWWYKGGLDRLNLVEPVHPGVADQANIKDLLRREDDPEFGNDIRFVDVPNLPNLAREKKGKKGGSR